MEQNIHKFWNINSTELMKRLNSDQENGLTKTYAAQYLTMHSPLDAESSLFYKLTKGFLTKFTNPLIILLLLSSILVASIGQTINSIIIALVVLISVSIDFIQESRSSNAADALKKSVATRTTVIRSGDKIEIDIRMLVPGDIAELSAGNLIPGDGIILEARDFFVNQASLTGESFPIEKAPKTKEENTEIATESLSAVFMGSAVVSGWAKILICNTKNNTLLGSISKTLKIEPPTSIYIKSTREFGSFLMYLTIILISITVLINLKMGRNWLDTILFAIALGVGMTPELLPMIISVTLARGAIKIAKKQVIVKKMSSIHALGSMDILCSDKTGTLTESTLSLINSVDHQGKTSKRTIELAYLNSSFETGLKNPLDEAIISSRLGHNDGWKKIDELPFNANHKRVTVVVEKNDQRILIIKGPTPDILSICSSYENTEKGIIQKLTPQIKKGLINYFEEKSKQGGRLLAVAFKNTRVEKLTQSDENELIFVGFLSFADCPKVSVPKAVKNLNSSGINLKIITGDNEYVTEHLCHELDIKVEGIITGTQINEMDNIELRLTVQKNNLFCRVSPEQKERIIIQLKALGHIVGFVGDGINDAPALHVADVSISVENAVEVAKDAADFIMLKRDLNVIYDGVLEGRKSFSNMLKYIQMNISSNFGNMLSMVVAASFLPFLPMLPTQVLINNLIYDITQLAIPFDNVSKETQHRPLKWNIKLIKNFMLVFGAISSLFDWIFFYTLFHLGYNDPATFQTAWFIESMLTQTLIIFSIRTRRCLFTSSPHISVCSLALAGSAIATYLPFSPFANYLGFVYLQNELLYLIAIIVIAYFSLVEITKKIFYRYN